MHRFDPTLATSVPFVAKFASQGHNIPTSAQVEVHMASKSWTWPAQDEILKTPVFTCVSHFFCASMTLHVARVSVGPNLAQSCRQRAPSCAMLGVTCTSMGLVSHGFKLRSIRIDLDPASAPTCAQRAHNVPCWTPSGLKLGPCLAQLKAKDGRVGPSTSAALVGGRTKKN